MVRLHVFAEGQTEQTFADTVLKPHLAQYNVLMQKPVLIAHAKKKGWIHRGGGRAYLPMKNDIMRRLKEDSSQDAFFTTMIDLYAIHAEFPGLNDAEKYRSDPEQRVTFLEQRFADDIGDHRFIPHIQLHEFEAYLFAEPDCFRYVYDDCARQIKNLRSTAEDYETPEMINDGQHSAPSKRIVNQFPAYERAKSVEGPQLAERIGLPTIRAKCRHFAAWLLRLEELGTHSLNFLS